MTTRSYDTFETMPLWHRWNGETIRVSREHTEWSEPDPPTVEVEFAWIYPPGADQEDGGSHIGAWYPARYQDEPATRNAWRIGRVMRTDVPAPVFLIPAPLCRICGKLMTPGSKYEPDTGWGWVQDPTRCQNCAFWSQYAESPGVVVDGHHYVIGEEPPPNGRDRWGLGHGGAHFRIRMLGSDVVLHSHNVWHQGEIPSVWRSKLPDNAEFLTVTQ